MIIDSDQDKSIVQKTTDENLRRLTMRGPDSNKDIIWNSQEVANSVIKEPFHEFKTKQTTKIKRGYGGQL